MEDHRARAAIIHLALFTGCGFDHGVGGGNTLPAQLANEAAHTLVAAVKAVVVDQILPDHCRVAALTDRLLDQVSIRLARARRRGCAGAGPAARSR